MLHSKTHESPVAINYVTAIGRNGMPTNADLLALLALALFPALLIGLTHRLPLDWNMVVGGIAVVALLLLPDRDLAPLLISAPLIAVVIGGIALLPAARARPTFCLIILAGATLRWYALGWGNGYIFHPDEHALAHGSASGILSLIIDGTARLFTFLSGHAAWQETWGRVLIGRSWSALLGTTLILATYILAVRLLRPAWALLATAYVAVLPILIQQSHLATDAQLNALISMGLLIASVALYDNRVYAGRFAVSLALLAAVVVPYGILLVSAPLAAVLARRRPAPKLAYAAPALLIVLAPLAWLWLAPGTPVTIATTPANVLAESLNLSTPSRPTTSSVYPLFSVFLWGLGPLLMQLGIVGYGVALCLSFRRERTRAWLPVAIAVGIYIAYTAKHAEVIVHSLTIVAPILCLTAALLLQMFFRRLPMQFGQRTVRLLAGTALCLALTAGVGLVNMYRAPDSRIQVGRWLMTHALERRIVIDSSVPPLSSMPFVAAGSTRLPAWHNTHNFASVLDTLAAADYLVVADEPSILFSGTGTDCIYRALYNGRLGLIRREQFMPLPHIGGWTLDDGTADPMLRIYDHPRLQIFERRNHPTREAITHMLRCSMAE